MIVSPSNATLLLQLERLVRTAGSDIRRVFRDAEGALGHLEAVLEKEERVRARVFLAGGSEG
jgi:hypothetical protein